MKKIKLGIDSNFTSDLNVIDALDQMVSEYNSLPESDYDRKWSYFWKCHSTICKLFEEGKIYIPKSNFDLEYLKTIIVNDGPEYSATISFYASRTDFYQIGVCVRGTPLLKKLP